MVLLRDHKSLHFYRIRDKDTLHVSYNSEADVEEILGITNTMQDMIIFMESMQHQLSQEACLPGLIPRITRAINSTRVESLAFKYFYPCSSERAEANRKLFIARGGLDLMHKLHILLLTNPWSRVPVELQYLEHAILRTLWNITASFSVRDQVLQRPTLEAISQSMLRGRVIKNQRVMVSSIHTSILNSVNSHELNRIVSEVIYKAIGTICK